MDKTEGLISQLYKVESPKILALLIRIFGMHNYHLAEDVLQDAFDKALSIWYEEGVPLQPSAWLLRVAKNKALDTIRANKTKTRFAEDLTQYLESEWSLGHTLDLEFDESNIKDDQLRMIFICCHEDIKPENRIPFILRSLCGFSIPAIMRAMMLSEATIKKRLLRTRQKIQQFSFELPPAEKLAQRMDSVHTVLYLLFNEGFHCAEDESPIKLALCHEAIALVNMLIDEPRIVNQDTFGLFALMHFHLARVASRVDNDGVNIPIDLQDRGLWKRLYIATANALLSAAQSVLAGASGRFYIEALIAKEHCNAADFTQTNWPAIVRQYDKLLVLLDSPIARLNRAIAIAYAGEVNNALDEVEHVITGQSLARSHLPMAVMAHLYAKKGDAERAYGALRESARIGGAEHEHRSAMAQVQRLLARKA